MKQKDIIRLPNPQLRAPSKRVGFISDATRKIVADMKSAALDWEDHRQHEIGVALAAVQIGCKQKIIVIRNDFDDKNDRSFQVLINPKITKLEGDLEEDFEGCLSVADVYGKVPRYSKVRVKAQDLDGQNIRLSADGFLARVLQHEIDHTKGIVFVDHIKNKPKAFYSLSSDGNLNPLDYDKHVKANKNLWG